MKTKEEARKLLFYCLPPHRQISYLVQQTKAGAYVRLFFASDSHMIEECSKLAAIAIEATYVEDKGIYRKGTGYGYGSDTVQELSYAIYKDSTIIPSSKL
jgi:hypothetical protein